MTLIYHKSKIREEIKKRIRRLSSLRPSADGSSFRHHLYKPIHGALNIVLRPVVSNVALRGVYLPFKTANCPPTQPESWHSYFHVVATQRGWEMAKWSTSPSTDQTEPNLTDTITLSPKNFNLKGMLITRSWVNSTIPTNTESSTLKSMSLCSN